MGKIAINFRYKKSGSWSKVDRVNFYAKEATKTLPVLGEYVGQIMFELEITSGHKVEVFLYGHRLKPKNNRFQIPIRKKEDKGRVGIRRLPIQIRTNEVGYTLNVDFPLDAAHLTKKQFQEMLDDISHWIFFELASSVKVEIDYSNKYSKALRSQQTIFNLIKMRMPEIETIIQQISLSPRQEIRKEYYPTSKTAVRYNPTTLRLASRSADETRSFTYRNRISYNVYENRFILFFFDQLKQRLFFLQEAVKRTIKDIENDIQLTEIYSDSERQVEELKRQLQEAKEFLIDSRKLLKHFEQLESIKFLRSTLFLPEHFTLSYSLGLTQDFNYGRIFSFYQELALQEDIKQLDIVRNFKKGLLSLGVKRTSKLYEYWTFFAVYKTLIELHFYPENDSGLLNIIKSDTLIPRLEAGKSIRFFDKDRLYEGIRIHLFYDKVYYNKKTGKENARPDITMEVWDGRVRKRFLFDAKYKNWDDGNAKSVNSKKKFWESDIKTVKKYSLPKLISDSEVAFLFHTNTSDPWFENYGAFIQDKENGKWRINSHKYGFIPVVPGETIHLRTLLAMIFLVKLEKRPKICFACGSTDIEDLGKRIICNVCHYEWQTSYCGLCRYEPLYRSREFNFQPYCKKCGLSICPKCGKCFGCRININEIKKRDLFLLR